MVVVVPGLGPWVPLPDRDSVSCPSGADSSHFSPDSGFVVPFVCVMDWPAYFGAETSPGGRAMGRDGRARPANRGPRCLLVPVGKVEIGLSGAFTRELRCFVCLLCFYSVN